MEQYEDLRRRGRDIINSMGLSTPGRKVLVVETFPQYFSLFMRQNRHLENERIRKDDLLKDIRFIFGEDELKKWGRYAKEYITDSKNFAAVVEPKITEADRIVINIQKRRKKEFEEYRNYLKGEFIGKIQKERKRKELGELWETVQIKNIEKRPDFIAKVQTEKEHFDAVLNPAIKLIIDIREYYMHLCSSIAVNIKEMEKQLREVKARPIEERPGLAGRGFMNLHRALRNLVRRH